MRFSTRKTRTNCKKPFTNALGFERLEDRRLLAIVWANEFGTGINSPNFNQYYGTDETTARATVKRAIADWNNVILDQNYDLDGNSNTGSFQLNVIAGNLATLIGRPNDRGATLITSFSQTVNPTWKQGIPIQATVYLDDNAAGTGWFFDATPNDDAEFTAIANSGITASEAAFQASFVDYSRHNPTTGVTSLYNDFYRTVVHEIGHALGITSNSNAAIAARFKIVYETVGSQQVDTGLSLYDGVNIDAMFDGGHFYQGPSGTPRQVYTLFPTVTFAEYGHQNELLNPGETVPPPNGSDPNPITRQFISDLDAKILADAYGYSIVLPSTINTAHASLDSNTGTLLVQGGVNSQGFGQVDTINISVVGANIRVQVNSTVESFPSNFVRQIVVCQNGGADVQSVTGVTVAVANVQQVVSTNQDSANAGTLGDEFVDIDTVVPGKQISLRAAIRDINGMAAGTARSIYVPRGIYGLTLSGPDNPGTDWVAQGDLDIGRNITIIGAGPGETIIDATPLRTTAYSDRVFDVAGVLSLYWLTVTGGYAPAAPPSEVNGGGILVRDGCTLVMGGVAVVNNVASTNTSDGGGIYFNNGAGGVINNSVVTGNYAGRNTGGIYLYQPGVAATVRVANSIIAKNTAANTLYGGVDVLDGPDHLFQSLGYNQLTTLHERFKPELGDYYANPLSINYVVSGIADSFNHVDDNYARSLREAIDSANTTSGPQTIWVPAWVLRMTRPGSGLVDSGDFDITSEMTIHGAAPGLTILDAGPLMFVPDDRIFDVTASGVLKLDHVTLQLGQAGYATSELSGGAVRVQDDGQFDVTQSAILGNVANSNGQGGGIYFAGRGRGSIVECVITVNESANDQTAASIWRPLRAKPLPGKSPSPVRSSPEINELLNRTSRTCTPPRTEHLLPAATIASATRLPAWSTILMVMATWSARPITS